MLLKNAVVYNEDFDPVRADVRVEGDHIREVGQVSQSVGDDEPELDLTGCTVMPGMIDIHIHGCAGSDVCDATPEALAAVSACLLQRGVTSFCPTSMTLPPAELARVFANVAAMRGKEEGAYIQGIHMEGPYIALSKKGAQNGAYVRPPDPEEFRRLYDGCGGLIRLVDVAPEVEGAREFIRQVSEYCTVSIAHTDADYDETVDAIEGGARHATHLYNAMNGLSHRAPGVVGAVFDRAREAGMHAELICDGFHVHPAALRVAFRLLGENGSIIVSDSMRAAGHVDGEYDLGGQTVTVRDGKCLLADGTIAASTANLFDEFKNVLRFGVPMRQAVKSVTINPARAIRVDRETGSIAPGKRADLLVLDEEMNIRLVMVKGRVQIHRLGESGERTAVKIR